MSNLTLAEKNLYSLYSYMSSIECVESDCILNLRYIKCEDSAWPNMIYSDQTDDAQLTFDHLSKENEKHGFPRILILNMNVLNSEVEYQLNQNRFHHVGEWTLMEFNSDTNFIDCEENRNIFEVSPGDLEKIDSWLKVVQDNLFKGRSILRKLILQGCNANRFKLIAAEQDGKVVSAALLFIDELTAGVYMVCTDTNYRNKGIARRAMKFAICEAKRLGCNNIVLQSTSEGLELYKKLSFLESGHLEIFYRV